CHANLQIVLETFSHAQPASKYSLFNGAETALTVHRSARPIDRRHLVRALPSYLNIIGFGRAM
ncbi:hypothetical protein CN130_16760, partial [Sinorhizobium meliloti]|uniref:hypothetical protein n=1 Tax=Rhizobium meliloti TaxID=382 RepID=UPI000FE0379D